MVSLANAAQKAISGLEMVNIFLRQENAPTCGETPVTEAIASFGNHSANVPLVVEAVSRRECISFSFS